MRYLKLYEELENKNYGILPNGERFWIGTINLWNYKIEEVHTYEEAKQADFHPDFYFSSRQLGRVREELCEYFWYEGEYDIGVDPDFPSKIQKDLVISPSKVIEKIQSYEYQKEILTLFPERIGELIPFGFNEKIKKEFPALVRGTEWGFFDLK